MLAPAQVDGRTLDPPLRVEVLGYLGKSVKTKYIIVFYVHVTRGNNLPNNPSITTLDPVDIVAYKLEMFRSGGIIRERQLILVIYQLEDFRLFKFTLDPVKFAVIHVFHGGILLRFIILQ